MSIVVEHEKRRREILENALDVFMDEGYENVTIQKIADRCGITRTTLYLYFKNKREIFNFSIKQLLSGLERDIAAIHKTKGLSCMDKLIQVLSLIFDRLEENRRLLSVILNFLLYSSREELSSDNRVKRRTVKLRHILANMVIEGIKAGEFTPVDVKAADDLLYSLLESAVFRLTALQRISVEELRAAAELAVRGLAVKESPAFPDPRET